MKNIVSLFVIGLLLGCSGKDQSIPNAGGQSSGFAEEMEYDKPPAPPLLPPQQNVAEKEGQSVDIIPKEKKIIRDGDMQLEVDVLIKAKSFVDSVMKKYDAYYENEIYESSDYQSSYYLKIRVPATHFDELINEASVQVGKIILKSINARDVTEEFYDVKIRLENNESYLLQYRNLLKRANSINDILGVQEKIRILEEEMDARKGRLKFLADQVNYSTLNLTLIQKNEWKDKNKKSFGERVLGALKDGGSFFTEFVLVMVRLWPFLSLFWFK